MKQEFVPYKRRIDQYAEKIKAEYADRPTEVIAKETGINYYTISRMAKRLGIRKSEAFMHTSWKKGGGKKGSKHIKSTEESDVYMQKHFADTANEELAKHFGVDVKTVRRWARRLNLVKSEKFMQKSRCKGGIGNLYTQKQIAWRNQRIADVFPDADKGAMHLLAEELGVGVNYLYTLAKRIGIQHRKYPPQLIEKLSRYFPTHTDKECADLFGIKKTQVQNLARKYGWKKSDAHVQKMYIHNITAAHDSNRRRIAD